MLPEWTKRPTTVANLLNPAFCGEVIRHSIYEYQKLKQTPHGLPFQLVFLIIPFVLHKGIRERLPSKSNKNFATWLEENQSVKAMLPDLIRNTVPYTKEGVMFLMIYNIIKINEFGELMVIEKPKKAKGDSEVLECYMKSDLTGRWLAYSGSSQSIFVNLGIKP